MNRDIIIKASAQSCLSDQDIRELYSTTMPSNIHWNKHVYFEIYRMNNLNNRILEEEHPKFGFTPQNTYTSRTVIIFFLVSY
jgi:hypothetical protein